MFDYDEQISHKVKKLNLERFVKEINFSLNKYANGTVIPHICQFWYTIALFKRVEVHSA